MKKGSEKQSPERTSERYHAELRQLAQNCGFNGAQIAVGAHMTYPRYRRIVEYDAEPTPQEADAIRGAIARMVGDVQKQLTELSPA